MNNHFLKISLSRLALVSLLFAILSCKKTGDEEPYIVPVVEIKGAIKLNDREVKLISTIKEIGTAKILEHGFLFSENATPSYATDLVWKSATEPDLEFEAIIAKALPTGETYFVQSFLKTEQAITYSTVYEFKTPGPTTLTIDKLFFPELTYYDDTVRVIARNLPVKLGDLNVQFQNANVEIIDLSEKEFRFKIPRSAPLDSRYEKDGSPLEFRVGTDIVNRVEAVKFPKPVFPAKTEVSMAYPWKLDGKYLYGLDLKLIQGDNTTQIGSMDISDLKDDVITVIPRTFFNTSTPEFVFLIRGNFYPISHIKIKTSDFEPNQQIEYTSIYDPIRIKTKDFNVFLPQSNRIVSSVPDQAIVQVSDVQDGVAHVSLNINGPVPNRKITLFAENHGERGKTPVQINIKTPSIPIGYLNPDGVETILQDVIGFKSQDEVHYLSEYGVVIYNTKTGNLSLGGANTIESFSISNFLVEKVGKYYFSEVPRYTGTLNTSRMFEYDPQKKEAKFVNYLPQDGFIISSFESDGYLFYEVMFPSGNQNILNLWKWEGKFGTEWEMVRTDTIGEVPIYASGKNFKRGNINYRTIAYFDASGTINEKLERYNTETTRWVFMKTYPQDLGQGFVAISAPEGIYLSDGNELYVLNPANWNLSFLGKSETISPKAKSMVYSNGALYYVSSWGGQSLNIKLDINLLKP